MLFFDVAFYVAKIAKKITFYDLFHFNNIFLLVRFEKSFAKK